MTGCPITINPYDQSGRISTPQLININYTCQDFWSLRNRLVGLIKEQFPNDFNDFVESSLAIMLIENWAFIADLLSFKIDQIANEIFIDTVSEVDNAFRLSLLVGFIPLPPIASSSSWIAQINAVLVTDLSIATPVIIDITTENGPDTIELFPADANNNPIFGDPIVIPAGSFSNSSVIGLEGRTRNQVYAGTGDVNQFYQLAFGPVIWGSIMIDVDGVGWNQVAYFTDSQPRPEFRVEYDANYNGYILFGNGMAGMSPSNGSQIQVTYRTGGGVAGNIVTGAVQLQRNFPLQGFEFQIPVSFSNYTAGQNGYDGDGILDIKRKLPAYLRTQNRVVSSDDYDTFINQFATPYNGIVGKGTAVVRNYGCAANIVDVYILALSGPAGLVEASNGLKVALQQALEEQKMIGVVICIKDGQVIEVDVSVDVVLDKFYRKFEDQYSAQITTSVNTYFSLNNWDYGKDLKDMDLIKQISNISEIQTVSINFVTDNADNSGSMVVAGFNQIIRPQTLEINFTYD